jgi:AcrR family transcriptional regulator
MVHCTMSETQARDRLLAAAVSHALSAGISDLSLRELAAAIGTSHRMLIYHFGSRQGLLVAIAKAVEESERVSRVAAGMTEIDAWQSWKHLSDPKLWPQERLFFELYSLALLGRPGLEDFLDDIVECWVTPIAAAMVEGGADPTSARVDARLGVAVVRGLILDLLATGDRQGTDAAFKRYIQYLSAVGQLPSDNPGVRNCPVPNA